MIHEELGQKVPLKGAVNGEEFFLVGGRNFPAIHGCRDRSPVKNPELVS
jgi:hypothetical protein